MTIKLYYKDSYTEKFEGMVVLCSEQSGEGYAICLDQSAFYPGGGGQSHDLGMLDGQAVLRVYEKEDVIYHVVEEPIQVGKNIEGKIDLARRMDYMQQHSGEHILSGIIHKLYGYANVGFHLADTYMTADFDGELTPEQLERVEKLAQEAVLQQEEILDQFYTQEEIKEISYRSKKALEGPIRLVTTGQYDCCACCGTHVKSTHEIGMIKVINMERYKGGMRLTVLCGERARIYYNQLIQEVKQVSGLLSAKVGSTPEALARMIEELGGYKQALAEQSKDYYRLKADTYKQDRPLCILESGLSTQGMKYLSEALAQKVQEVTLILNKVENGFQYCVISKEQDVRPFCKLLNERLEGKGGGKPNICQGSAVGSVEEAQRLFYETFPSWVEEIRNYKPYNEQETTDQAIILEYIEQFDNTLERANAVAHLTSSAWIVNKDRTKVLMAYHNIYDTWAWTGGHSDGDGDHLGVAIKEAIEETGIQQVTPIHTEIFSLDVLPVEGHIKRGKYVAPHLHLSVAYLLEADEEQELVIKPDENSGVKWILVEEINQHTMKEPKMQELYAKFMEKLQAIE